MSTANRAGDNTDEEGLRSRPTVPADGAAATAGGSASWRAPAGSWRGPAGLVIIAVTVLGLVVRTLLLTRPGFLTSGTVEYDDGVYLGAAIRLLQGAVPYRDFAYVQPPGILVVSLPFALVAKTVSASAGLASARVATMLASTACIPLAGRLVRHKGVFATLVTCGFLAVYPADLLTARTLLLEPWMNLCCLLAVSAAFTRGRLAGPRRLAWAGAALGIATGIKLWAAIPAVVLLCFLLAGDGRWQRVRGYLAGLVAGFVLLVLPFAAAAPVAFVRSTVSDQVTRMGSYTSLGARLSYLTGLMPVIDGHGHVNLFAHEHSLLAVGANGTMVVNGSGRAPYAMAALGVLILAAAYLRRPSSRSPLEWFALVVAGTSLAAVSVYSAFFYHYPDFPAPWLAIAFGAAAGAAAGAMRRARAGAAGTRAQQVVAAAVGVVVLAVAILEGSQLAGQSAPYTPSAADRIIPAGACVVADQVSFTIAANRFTAAKPGCPDVLDSLAATLVLSGGTSVPGGAGRMPRVEQGWEAIFARAQYVWLTQGSPNRIPWTPGLTGWFDAHFRMVRAFRGYGHSELYEHR